MSKKNRKSTKNKKAWFYKVRGSYLPANRNGWLTYIPFIAYTAFTYIVGIKDISKAWVSALFILSSWIAATAVMTMLAIRKS